jgi:YidC/Oxa1 family membrane protein insertase
MTENRNTILAVILSGLVLLGWQYFFNLPQLEKQRAVQQAQSEMMPSASAPAINQPVAATPTVERDTAIAAAPRVKIETPRLSGSLSLKGARIDDLSLVQFRDTVDPLSPAIVLFSP